MANKDKGTQLNFNAFLARCLRVRLDVSGLG